ncbi:acyltransferase family protein [Hymenobacter baengnokdamensis]|uniref:acyltransferase family protein n=1 Tax=Hymenobacter baengnokdamensis TaxID=2615203 RepID=UPI001247BFEE|nr:heparan-alpha-glucosaminide N-acetyltransferase domain-containing protein [Hymenobacter baengnokdamensis]
MRPADSVLPARLVSLDVFRGLTVMAMVVVNNPGDWGHIYPPFEHAEWNGCTPTDLVFPFFLFIVGVSLAYALAGAKSSCAPWGPVLGRVARRAAILFALGVLTSLYPHFDFGTVRLMGVLQRIALVYLACSCIYLKTSWRTQAIILLGIVIGYAALMQLVPVPGIGPANLEPATNLGAWLDRTLLTEPHLWAQSRTWDPEGLLGTLPALATGLLGALAGQWLRWSGPAPFGKTAGLSIAAVAATTGGLLWETWFPLNKALWTSSYVLFTGGLALGLLAALYWLCDVRRYRRVAPALAFGVNAIAVFFFSAILSRTFALLRLPGPAGQPVGLKEWLYGWGIALWFSDPRAASLAGAVVCLLIWLGVLSLLRRQNWVWKV